MAFDPAMLYACTPSISRCFAESPSDNSRPGQRGWLDWHRVMPYIPHRGMLPNCAPEAAG